MKKLFILFSLLFLCNVAHATPPTRQNNYLSGTTIRSDEVNEDFNDLFGYLNVGVDNIRANGLDAITEIHSNLKSGSDGTLITGTEGASGECAQWDANGDLVTAGAACGTGSGTTVTSAKYNDLVDPDNNGGISFTTFTNTWTTAVGNANYFIIDGSGTDFVVQGDGDTTVADLTVGGDDIIMATNTSGAVLVADGTNFNPVVMGTDATISSAGALTIAANAVALGTDTTGNYASGDAEDGNVAADKVLESSLKAVDSATDEDLLTYESTTGDFEWHTCAQITGSADLCDGSDASGGAGSTPRLDQVLAPGTNVGVGFNFGAFTNSWTFSSGTNTWTSSAGDARFFTINNASSNPFIIRGDGQVGIGVTDPDVELDIRNTGTGPDIYVTSLSATGVPGVFVTNSSSVGAGLYIGSTNGLASTLYNEGAVLTSASNLIHEVSGSGNQLFTINGSDRMFIDATNVGIGTTNPKATLDTNNGTIKGYLPYDYVKNPGTNAGASFGAFTNTWTVTNADTRFFTIDATADFVVRADGNVGIGQTDPSTALVVTGTATATTSVSTPLLDLSGTGTINGLDAIDSTGETTLEATLDLAGDVSSTGMSSTIIGNKAVRIDEIADAGTNAGISFGAFTNSWTFSTGTNTWTSGASTTDFFDIESRTLTTGDSFTIKVDDGMTTGSALQVLGGVNSTTPVIFVDDSDVAIGTTACDGSNHKLCVGGSGNTGIGTSTPAYKLQVSGISAGNSWTATADLSFFSHESSSPCAIGVKGGLFTWNATGEPCYCDVSGNDISLADGTSCD